jgi:hypothetical protein
VPIVSKQNANKYFDQVEYILKPKKIPHLQLKDSYYRLAKALSYEFKLDEVLKYLALSEELMKEVYGTSVQMKVASIHRTRGLSYLRCNLNTLLDDDDAMLAMKEADKSLEIVNQLVDESVPNYYRAKSI